MRPASALPWLLVPLLLAPLAAAAQDATSTLEANDPISLNGKVDSAYVGGVASWVSTRGEEPISLTLHAAEIAYTDTDYSPATCAPSFPVSQGACTPSQPAAQDTLRDATLTIEGATGAYQVALTNNRSQGTPTASFGAPGSLVATTGPASLLGTNPNPEHLSGYDTGWTSRQAREPGEPFYAQDANGFSLSANGGGSLSADQGMRLLLQGVKVHLQGTSASTGGHVDRVLSTHVPDGSNNTHFLVVDATRGELAAQSDAPFTGYGIAIADVHGSAQLTNPTGHTTLNGQAVTINPQSDMTLPGPVSLGLVGAKAGNPARIVFTVSNVLRVLPPVDPRSGPSPAALVGAGAAGAGTASLLALAIYFWPRLRFGLTVLALPLYSRIERTEVLEHHKRDEIYELIRATPGIHAHEIGEKALIGWGTTVYHLRLLEGHGLVVSKKSGRYKRFFVNTGEYTKKKDVYGALRNETAKRVAQFIAEHPGASQKEMCEAVGIQPSLASWHVEKLEGVGLVKRVKDGRQVRYFAGPAWSDLNVQVTPQGADASAET